MSTTFKVLLKYQHFPVCVIAALDPGMMTGDMFDDCANETDGDGKACRFDRYVFGSCQPPYFGWDEGKPCLFLSLNRVSEPKWPVS